MLFNAAHLQILKHSVPKNDKKKKKEILVRVEELEAELKERHEQELLRTSSDSVCPKSSEGVTSSLHDLNLSKEQLGKDGEVDNEHVDETSAEVPQGAKVSKAQKRRDKKAQLEREMQDRIENEDVTDLAKAKVTEAGKLAKVLKERGLKIIDIPSDGDCMYKAIGHQLELHGTQVTVKSLRCQTSDHLRKNRDDYLPFLVSDATGDLMSYDEFESYCICVEKTKAWGGQIELRALSQLLRQAIEVVQADGPPMIIGDSSNGKKSKLLLR